MQYGFNRLANADTLAKLDFNQQIEQYHQQIRHFFWSIYFPDKAFEEADFDEIPAFNYSSNIGSGLWQSLLKLLVITAVFAALMWRQLRRFHEH